MEDEKGNADFYFDTRFDDPFDTNVMVMVYYINGWSPETRIRTPFPFKNDGHVKFSILCDASKWLVSLFLFVILIKLS